MTLVTALASIVAVAGPATAATVARSPLAAMPFYVDPHSAAVAAERIDPAHAADYAVIAAHATGFWFSGGTPSSVRAGVSAVVGAAAADHRIPVLVAYDVPLRDCGGWSSGGATSASAYATWVAAFAAGIGTRPAVVVLEPDALAGMDCLSATEQTARLHELANAVAQLRAHAGVLTYLDAGHSGWHSVAVMAHRLAAAGVASARGFALDVSGFDATGSELAYGNALSAALGGRHFVVDTSRNGRGAAPGDAWCNPAGRGLGSRPTAATGDSAADAFLWVKRPGESDGACGPGQPPAGAWYGSYAVGLVERASW